jgi:hypothetical protein
MMLSAQRTLATPLVRPIGARDTPHPFVAQHAIVVFNELLDLGIVHQY